MPSSRGKVQVGPDPEIAPGFDFDFESEPMHVEQLRYMIMQEVRTYDLQGQHDCLATPWIS